MEIKMSFKDIHYVQLESRAFTSDIDFQTMTLEERGAYLTVILYLYVNGGELRNDGCAIAMLCNCRIPAKTKFAVWENIKHKFKIKGGKITHKRVTEELQKCEKYRSDKSKAGSIGANRRWHGDNKPITEPLQPDNTAITQPYLTKTKGKSKVLELTNLAITYDKRIEKSFAPLMPKERVTFRNIRFFLQKLDLEQVRTAIDWIGVCKVWGEDHDKTLTEVKKCYVSKIKKLGWKPNGK